MPSKEKLKCGQQLHTLFAQGGDITANTTEGARLPSSARKHPEIFCCTRFISRNCGCVHDHAQRKGEETCTICAFYMTLLNSYGFCSE